ncbi:MAG TPA: lipase secretion chaperone [Aquabacterium sp.]|uniref:lipase secretion chaperone n=1 Tax=Aquabacterium sp. TaxID=1872578 RepID=UPI002E31105C|nr:lipase secretion chaperone [Aquabacterium sp.]HEX5355566.1 lipase secretion chaperone [Aquabacterium sp.]
MTRKKWWILSALTATLMATGLWGLRPTTSDPTASSAQEGFASWFKPHSATPGPPADMTDTKATAHAQTASSKPASPLDTMILPTFRATSHGDLAMDQQTRLDVERIYALFPRDEARAKLESQSADLPAQAQRELKDLFQKYAQYAQAVAQTFPPEQNSGSLEEAARQFNELKALRRQYFGDEQAQSLFGEEEKTAQELLALMRKQTDPKLSLEEKAEQAQAEWKRRQGSGQP